MDLEWVEREVVTGSSQWVVFDPVQVEYYFFSDVERRIAVLLDGRKSIQSIIAMVLPAYPSTDAIPFVSRLVQRMDHAGLLIANQWVKSRLLLTVDRVSLQSQNSILGFKVPVCDPSPFIRLIGPIANVLFSWPSLMLVIVFSLSVIWNLIPNASVLMRDLQLATRMSVSQAIVLGCILFIIKLLHEVGHALAGFRFGVLCREVGVFVFFGIPCLYCDMTDSWRVKGKWSRITIAAAGIYVEWIVAILAGIVWFSNDSMWIRISSVQIMLACSISTLLFNANPLLRYDGYFAVADMLGIVNLMDRARTSWNALWCRLVFKSQDTESNSLISDSLYGSYYLLSMIYRWFLIGSLLLGVYAWFGDRNLRAIAPVVPLLLMSILLLQIAISYIGIFRRNAGLFKLSRFRWGVILVLSSVWCLAVYGLFFWRSAEYFITRAIVEPEGVIPVFLPHDATVVELLPDGANAAAGERIGLASSFELNDELLRLEGELSFYLVRKDHWEKRSTQDPTLVQSIVELNQKILGLENQIAQSKQEIQQLSMLSPCNGIFSATVDVPWKWKTRGSEEMERINILRGVKSNPVLKRGTLLGTIAPTQASQLENTPASSKEPEYIRAYVSERDISKITVGDSVSVFIEQQKTKVGGTIYRVGQEPVRDVPVGLKDDEIYQSLAFGSKQGTIANEYLVSIRIPDLNRRLIRGGLATVQFHGQKRTLAEWVKNFVLRYGRRKTAPEVAAP